MSYLKEQLSWGEKMLDLQARVRIKRYLFHFLVDQVTHKYSPFILYSDFHII